MRDGTVLRADVWRPLSTGRRPVLLQRSPYGKTPGQISIVNAGIDPLRAAEGGYVVVIQDTRGRFASEGTFDPFRCERDDGEDTLAWLAGQPFSDGTAGMYGGSYFGATQLLAASARPPGLRAIVPAITGSEYYEGWTYQGGAFQLGFVLFWTLASLAPDAVLRAPEAERPRLQELLDGLLADPWAAYRRLPLDDLGGLEQVLPYYREWLAHPARDAWWRETAPNERYGAIEVPALHVGGWYDIFVAGTVENFARLREEAGTEPARRGQRLVVGPWAHVVYGDTVGQQQFGAHAAWAGADPTPWQLAWFDAHVRGLPAPDAAPVELFLMGANRWLEDDEWPPRGVAAEAWHLRGGGALDPAPPEADEQRDELTYDPHDPVPTCGGATLMPGFTVGYRTGAHDQREVERREDVLTYTSEPLASHLDVIGPVTAVLHVATSAPDTDFTAKLVDVHPDGRAWLICDGIRALRHRDGLERAVPATPGEPYELTVELGPTANRFLAGHRVRLEVSSSNFPRFARNPNNGVLPTEARETDLTPARQAVFHDAARPSRLVLPVRR